MFRDAMPKRCEQERTPKSCPAAELAPAQAVRAGVARAWPIRRPRPRSLAIRIGG